VIGFVIPALDPPADEVTLVRHPVNRGKGEALRTAFALMLDDPDISTIVTLDADGQHRLDDVVAVAARAAQRPVIPL
jgi:hypothetical protein